MGGGWQGRTTERARDIPFSRVRNLRSQGSPIQPRFCAQHCLPIHTISPHHNQHHSIGSSGCLLCAPTPLFLRLLR